MIIQKREHIESMQMAKPLKSLIDDLANCELRDLPVRLNANLKWERPRGDLLHWIPVLNRMDSIFEEMIKKYGLNDEFVKLQIISLQDQSLIIACLQFTHTLLEHCSDRSIYASSERVFDLINTPTVDVRLKALEVAVLIAEKFAQNNNAKYSAPKSTKQKVLELARSYPPMVPVDSAVKQQHKANIQKKDEKSSIIGDHFNFVDTLTSKKKYPSKWKYINFQYYKSSLLPLKPESHASTTTEASKKKESKKKPQKLVVSEGLNTFTMGEDVVRKLTLEQIYDKAAEVIPKEFWFNFGMHAAVAKSFNTKSYESMKLREKLLQIKCLAVGFTCNMFNVQNTSSKLFEAEPYIFSFLVDAVSPENIDRVPKDVHFTAIRILECISLKRVWGGDIIRCMGGNVSHGVLFQLIRHICKMVKEQDDDYFEEGYIHFFNMLGNMINTKSLIQKLTAGGILNDLMAFMNLHTKYRWSCSAASHLIAIYLTGSPSSLDDFVANNGFNLLIEAIGYEVDFALENPEYGGGPPKNAIVHYTISFRQANYIRNLMKLVADIIQSDVGDRLRNLFDSPLLESFNKILTHPHVFGPLILSSTVDSVFYIIHNEPTAFSILNEAKVIDTILDNYESLFLPSSELLMSLPEVLGAICLNNEGLRKIKEKKIISTYFKTFYNLPNAKELVNSDMSTNLGCSFDELGRHFPSLKPVILAETKSLIENVSSYVDDRLSGVKFYSSKIGSLYKSKDEPSQINEDGEKEIESWDTSDYAYLLDNVYFFLGGLLQDSGQWGPEAIQKIEFKTWVKFLTLKNAPYDYLLSNGISSLMGILKYFDDEKRDYGLPVVLDKLKELLDLDEVQNYIQYSSTEQSYFATLDEKSATLLFQHLNSINTILYAIAEIYINLGLMFQERFLQIIEHFGGYGLKTISDLALLLERSILEETIIRSSIPDEVSKLTSIVSTDSPPLLIHATEPSKDTPESSGTSAKFKNTLQIRFFSYYFQSYISLILACIARACTPKRQDFADIEMRRDGVEIIIELGKVFASAISRPFTNKYVKYCYILNLSNSVLYILSQKERARDTVLVSFAISLFQNGYFESLQEIAVELWNELLLMDPLVAKETAELKYISTHESSIVKNALSQVLMIFAKSVNSEIITFLPFPKLYFASGYESDVESKIISSLVTQIRGIAFKLLEETIGLNSKISDNGSGVTAANIPSPLVEQMVYIAKHVYSGKNESSEVEFIPFDVRNVFPPSDQVAYLISLGMSESQANHFFKHGLVLKDIVNKTYTDCPQMHLTVEEWDKFSEEIQSDDHDFSVDFPTYRKSKEIIDEKKRHSDMFVDEWLNIATQFPKVVAPISELFATFSTDKVVTRLGFLVSISKWRKEENSSAFGVYLHLISLLFSANADFNSFRGIFENMTTVLHSGILHDEYVNESFFPFLMSILEALLVYKDDPEPSETKHESIRYSKSNTYYRLDDDIQLKIFKQLIEIKEIRNSNSANSLARVLAMYAKNQEYSQLLRESEVVKYLIKTLRTPIKEKPISESLKTSIVLILRYAFETPEVKRNLINFDVANYFNITSTRVKDLYLCLKDQSDLIWRDAEAFEDILCKDVRLEGYSGSEFFLNKIPIKKIKKTEEDTEDVKMTDATTGESQPKRIETPTVMNILLNELMSIVKSDWLADPVEAPETKEVKKEDLFSNELFGYGCFLIQTITELLGSYKLAKFEFLTFSKKMKPNDPLKPRSSSLNFFFHQLVPTHSLEKSSGVEYERRCAISSIAKMTLLALTSTPILDEDNNPDAKKEDPDLGFIRRYVVEVLTKILKDTIQSNNLAQVRYGKLFDLFELTGLLVSTKFRDAAGPLLNNRAIKFDQFYISKVYIEKQVPNLLTSLLADLDLNFPDIERVVKAGLKPLSLLGKSKVDFQELFAGDNQGENDDDDIMPEDVDDREETPDLFRNSTLGMYDVDFNSEDEDSDMYYDEEGPLEVLSGEEIESDDESSELSAIDSDQDDVEISMDDEHASDDEYYGTIDGDVSDSSIDDIEIIDELDLGSHSDGEGEEGSSSESGLYEYEDEGDLSEYDEDELDGWIEQLEDGDHYSSDEDIADEQSAVTTMGRVERSVDLDADDESDGYSSNEGISEIEVTLDAAQGGRVRRLLDQAGLSQLDRTSPALAQLFDRLFREGGFRGTFEVSDQEDSFATNPIGRIFDNMLHLRPRRGNETGESMHIKSTRERWQDAFKMFYPKEKKDKNDLVLRVIPDIVNRIEEDSIALYKQKQSELEKIRKEREEKLKKKIEEEAKKKLEEAKQRELNAANAPPHEPVMVRIGDRDVDIGGTEIDRNFIEALPEDMREEVFTQYVRERRANATSTGEETREIDPDFLEALPGHIRDEILQQEAMTRRYASFEEGLNDDEETGDQEGEDEDEFMDFEVGGSSSSRRASTAASAKKPSKKVFFTPLVDRPGISALIRLLFSPLSINQREHVYHSLHYLCHNKQSRIEIMSLLIAIVYDCFTNQRPIEKIYTQVCSRANGSKDIKSKHGIPVGATQISVGIQIIEAIDYLLERNSHLRYYLLTEHENVFLTKKANKTFVKLGDSTKEGKFALNHLLRLLDNVLVREDQTFLDLLARVLQVSTRPLQVLKEHENESSPLQLPVIRQENYRQIIKILTGNDCSNTTFRRTISAMQNLSVLPNAQKAFSMELSDQASTLGFKIITDLNNLTKELRGTNYSSESKSFSKFSAHSSDQAKLLRILTALDYMFETKERERKQQDKSFTSEPLDEIEELTGLYKKLALGTLWDALSECLRVLEENPQLHNVANALLPLIEALMVVCKHSKVRELPLKEILKYEAKKIDFTKEPIESLFFSFTDEHKKILNQMVRVNPNLMSGPFGMLVRNPRVLEFDNKKNYFDRKLHQDKKENSKLSVNVRRDQVFLDSYRSLFFKSRDEFRNSKLEINFKGEQGIDAGGVTREWYQVLSRQMFNPDYALFTPVVADRTTFHPNRTSYINPEHLSFFKFIGRIIGKAIYDNCYLDCHFSRAVYKQILGKKQSLKDMESLDLEYTKSLMWMLENDITDVITEDFSVETDDYGEHKIIDLIPNGRNIPVTEENKQEYVKKVVEYRLQTSVEEQMDNFLIGFHEIIPKDLIAIFDEQELELLISGLPDINVSDWQSNTIYNNYSPSSIQIQWFWRAVKSFDNEERARLLQFATGTSKVPLNGFKELSGASGTCKFSIHRDYGSTDRLPSSHTCFNQVDLPAYESYETLRGSLLMAITEGHEGFGLA
ncbi:E3 ubiquitin protein ligase TOM1 [Spathaspora passalidarum NRRL Y-27907]|uniref:HECT-type E3 ubiquitin transferase n=1 Tax=Spathaspora passalidarum (strain NRRL Y-27907 / 11-Y1) TaxID=619300 RepID=G3AML8_SPAPN|nr:E3 ubiquitin protein ligase TOM1 [Spathaspora passalidarum NRRL Y-27907]EGW33462.1 E3 ubiquitin protein ligase TOM1 [Spathaspora passalidarum NRRL Y-27907]